MFTSRLVLDRDIARPAVRDQLYAAQDPFIAIKEEYPTAVIAGGAPRDWLKGEYARDVDIFIYEPNAELRLDKEALRLKLTNILTIQLFDMSSNAEYEPQVEGEGIVAVFRGHHFYDVFGILELNIVVHNAEVTEVYKRFPASLSRYWIRFPVIRGSIDIHQSVLAWLGERNKKIYCKTREFTPAERAYLIKIWNKVPLYEVVDDNEGFEDATQAGFNTEREHLV